MKRLNSVVYPIPFINLFLYIPEINHTKKLVAANADNSFDNISLSSFIQYHNHQYIFLNLLLCLALVYFDFYP